MKLYYAPGACSVGIHVLLEEIGKPYELAKLDLKGGEQTRPPFSTLNPKGKVPTLQRDDGSVITEYPVIAYWLAKTNPEAGLMPTGEEAELQAARAAGVLPGARLVWIDGAGHLPMFDAPARVVSLVLGGE